MSNNWRKTIDRINHERYSIPDGWFTREQVAGFLECDPSKVSDLLKPGIEAGAVKRKPFTVWDSDRRMASQVVCYQLAGNGRSQDTPAPKPVPVASGTEARIRAAIARNPNHTAYEISKNIRGTTTAMVKALMS